MSQVGYKDLVWFLGVVEDRDDPQRLGRIKVRCFNVHPQDKQEVPTDDLPWAYLISGTYSPDVKPPPLNSWVFGFFIDGRFCQQPMILGTLNGMPTQLPDIGPNGTITSPGNVRRPEDIPDIYQPDMSRLARGEDLDETSVLAKNIGADEPIPTAGDGPGWTVPRSPYNASYPNNRVYESAAGHVMEFDDTPGSERVNIYHSAGSWIEIDSHGNMVISSTGQKFEIVNNNSNVYIRGTQNVTVDGNSNFYVKRHANINVDGDMNTNVKGDYVLNVGGRYALNIREGVKLRGSNVQLESYSENIEITSAVDIISNAESNISTKSGLDTYINAGVNTHMLSGTDTLINGENNVHINAGVDLFATGMSNANLKASGGEVYIDASGAVMMKSGTETIAQAGGSMLFNSSSGTDINSGGDINIQGGPNVNLNNGAAAGVADPATEAETALQGLDSTATEMGEPPERGSVTPNSTVPRGDFGGSGLDDTSDVQGESGSSSSGAADADTGSTTSGASTASAIQAAASGKYAALLDLIADGESGGDYNIVYSGTRVPHPENLTEYGNKPLTELSIGDLLNWMDYSVAQGSYSSASGRYQVIRGTLRGAVSAGVVTTGDLYDQTNQDLIANYLLEVRGISRWESGELTDEQFANRLAYEWASLPLVTGPNRGSGAYDADGVNAANHTPEEILSVLRSIKG